MHVQLLSITDPGKVCLDTYLMRCSQVCYASTREADPERYLQARIKAGHLSILEHATASFLVTGISRTCSHQLVRHRLVSFTQLSQRYVDHAESDFVVPPSIKQNNTALDVYAKAVAEANKAYGKLIDLGIRKEDARFVTPQGVTTQLVATANFREWLHVFDVRLDKHAQWEIRNVMEKILEILAFHSSIFRVYMENEYEAQRNNN